MLQKRGVSLLLSLRRELCLLDGVQWEREAEEEAEGRLVKAEAEEDLQNKLHGEGTTTYNTQHMTYNTQHTDIATTRLTRPTVQASGQAVDYWPSRVFWVYFSLTDPHTPGYCKQMSQNVVKVLTWKQAARICYALYLFLGIL